MRKLIAATFLIILTCSVCAQPPFYGDRPFISSDLQDTLWIRHIDNNTSMLEPDGMLRIPGVQLDSIFSGAQWYYTSDIISNSENAMQILTYDADENNIVDNADYDPTGTGWIQNTTQSIITAMIDTTSDHASRINALELEPGGLSWPYNQDSIDQNAGATFLSILLHTNGTDTTYGFAEVVDDETVPADSAAVYDSLDNHDSRINTLESDLPYPKWKPNSVSALLYDPNPDSTSSPNKGWTWGTLEEITGGSTDSVQHAVKSDTSSLSEDVIVTNGSTRSLLFRSSSDRIGATSLLTYNNAEVFLDVNTSVSPGYILRNNGGTQGGMVLSSFGGVGTWISIAGPEIVKLGSEGTGWLEARSGEVDVNGVLTSNQHTAPRSRLDSLGIANPNAGGYTYFDSLDFANFVSGSDSDIDVISSNYTDSSNATTSYEVIYADTIPAGSLSGNGDIAKLHYYGRFANNGNTKDMRISIDGGSNYNFYSSPPSSVGAFDIEVTIIRDGSGTGKLYRKLIVEDASGSYSATGNSTISTINYSSDVIVQVQGDGGAADDITINFGYVEIKKVQ